MLALTSLSVQYPEQMQGGSQSLARGERLPPKSEGGVRDRLRRPLIMIRVDDAAAQKQWVICCVVKEFATSPNEKYALVSSQL